jgi:hypothetical protein
MMESMAAGAATYWDATVRSVEDAVRAGAQAIDLDYIPGGMLGGEIEWSWSLPSRDSNGEIYVIAAFADDGLQVSVQAVKSPNSEEASTQRRAFWTDFVELHGTDAAALNAGVADAMRKAKAWLTA